MSQMCSTYISHLLESMEVAAPPFQLTRFGWGTFEVGITIHLQDASMQSPDLPHTGRIEFI